MNLSEGDKELLEKLCQEHSVNLDKVLKLLETVDGYEFKDRRIGVFDELRDILKSEP